MEREKDAVPYASLTQKESVTVRSAENQ